MDEYLSCNRFVTSFEIEKSVFEAAVAPVRDEAEAEAFVSEIRAKHPDATHNCYAYLCDVEKNIYRFSDDGEPGKTAGLPILEAIRGRGLFNTGIVVSRWFGGIKLGAGGLVRAYSRAALAAIDGAGARKFERAVALCVNCGYEHLPKFESYLKNRGRDLVKEFGERVSLRFWERERDVEAVERELLDFSGGRSEIIRGGRNFRCFGED